MTAAVPLYDYQSRWFRDRSRFKIGMFARQTGKTFTTTLEIVDDVFQAMVDGKRVRWVILSRGERQSKEAMEEGVKLHARAYNLGPALLGLRDRLRQEHVRTRRFRIAGGAAGRDKGAFPALHQRHPGDPRDLLGIRRGGRRDHLHRRRRRQGQEGGGVDLFQ